MRRLSFAVSAAIAASFLVSPGRAQVVITEVHPTEGWIELHNRSATTTLSDHWSILCTTTTPGYPNEYWWAVPNDLPLAPGGFLRIHWFSPWRPATADEIWTGTAPTDFLFGLGGEPLDRQVGSVALLGSQEGSHMGTPAYYLDWITWGRAGRPREAYAVNGLKWIHGDFVPAPGPDQSIALAEDPAPEPTPASMFFLDATPSPLAANQQGADVRHFGSDCAVGVFNAPALDVDGVPATGNANFRLRVNGTSAVLGQSVIVMIGLGQGVGVRLPLPSFTCPLWVDGAGIAPFVIVLPATRGVSHTDVPLSLRGAGPELAGVTLYVQAITGRIPLSPFDHAASDGLAITIGG